MRRLAARLRPGWLADVDARGLRADLVAGLLGAVLVLPQGIAFATLAGLPPEYGLYTAVVPCIVAALAGSSRHVVTGPTNALSLALVASVGAMAAPGSAAYVELVLAVTLLVGLVQALVGALRLGAVANFISPAALLGFTSGAALLIAVHAVDDLLGVYPGGSRDALAALRAAAAAPGAVNPAALLVGAATAGAALLARRLAPRWPHLLLGLAAGSALAWALEHLAGLPPVRRLGALGPALPPLHVPQVPWSALSDLAPVALALTIVALGQSISIAKAVGERSGQPIDASREFLGQGLANLAGGFFSSYVASGSLNRSMPNFEAGARTPLAAVFSALLVVALIAFAGPLVGLLPLAAVAGLLLLVAWGLIDLDGWRRFSRLSRTDFWVAAATAAATLLVRVEMAILLGTGLSLVAYLYRTSRPAMRTMGFDAMAADRRFVVVDGNAGALPECPQIKLLRMEGPIFFGAAPWVAERLRRLRARPHAQPHLLVMAKSMNFIDAAGEAVWQAELKARRAAGGDLWFHRPRPEVLRMWGRSGFLDALGADHVFQDKRSAIAAIYERIDPAFCAACPSRSTWECTRRAARAEAAGGAGGAAGAAGAAPSVPAQAAAGD